MTSRCWSFHPDDFGPIQRRCGRDEGHEGPHEYAGFSGFGKPHKVDRWEDE